ncbi:WG repeat-containing protein [bacterium]|nr:WG repeat-containing protein [bacterium]
MMKNIIISIFLLFSVLLLQAEEEKDVVLRMTEDELKACYADKEKTEQRFLIKKDYGLIGFIDGCGRVVIEPVYDSALEFSEGLARVEKNGKFGFIDKSGKVVIDFYLDFACFFHEGKALAEIHGNKEEKFYIDKNNKKYPARNGENPTEKIIKFRKHYDNLIFKEYETGGNALAFGGLITRKRGKPSRFYTDYSGQKLRISSVLKDEFIETCKNTKLLESDGNITFVKNGKTLKTIKNISVYSFPVCQENLTGIVWLKKDRGVSFYENLIRAGRIFLNISEETLFIYNLDGIKIAGFENDHIIRKIEYLDENSIKVSFYDGREPEFFDLTGKKRRIEDIEEKPFWLPGIKCDFICEAERKGKKLSLEDRTKYKICPKTGYEYRDKRIDGKFVREIYNTKTGATIITIGAYASLRNYESLEGGCLSVIETPENIYYLNDDYKVFWSGRR